MTVFLAACGGPPGDNPLLDETRSEFWAAQNNQQVVEYAPVALKDAEESLKKTEEFWRDEVDDDVIEHYAYLTRQRIRIAEEKAELNAAEEEIERAEVERQKVMLEVREEQAKRSEAAARQAQQDAQMAKVEADRASEEAKREAREAEIARKAARDAIADAEALAERVAELEAKQTERGLVLTLGDILFDFDKASLKPGGRRAVRELAAFLKDYPERTVVIEGFTDNIGSTGYNLDLSERRAQSVESALIAEGLAPSRIQTYGFGEAHPVAGNQTDAGRQRNRRVEVIVSDKNGVVPDRVD